MDAKMWPIQIAKDSVFEIAALGYNGIKLFARLDTSPKFIEDSWEKDLESYDEVIDRIATICGTGQDYFRMWLRDDKKELNYICFFDRQNFQIHISRQWLFVKLFLHTNCHLELLF